MLFPQGNFKINRNFKDFKNLIPIALSIRKKIELMYISLDFKIGKFIFFIEPYEHICDEICFIIYEKCKIFISCYILL